jgi:hypothetical protein
MAFDFKKILSNWGSFLGALVFLGGVIFLTRERMNKTTTGRVCPPAGYQPQVASWEFRNLPFDLEIRGHV